MNLRRIMARLELTQEDVVKLTHVDQRTLRGILSGRTKPHERTISRLAEGLGVLVDEFFQDTAQLAHRTLDRQTNPLVEEVVRENPAVFSNWRQEDFDELYSRFGTGGALTADGAVQAARKMNHHRDIRRKVALLLETGEAEFLTNIVEMLYQKVAIVPAAPNRDEVPDAAPPPRDAEQATRAG